MNVSQITQAQSPVAQQLEMTEGAEVPAVSEIGKVETTSAGLSGETEAGILRFARFLKQAKDQTGRHSQGIQAYKRIADFSDGEGLGSVLDTVA